MLPPSPVRGNPMTSGKYSAPPMTQAEYDRIAIPLQDVHRGLRQIMEEHGCAIVTGVVASAQELSEMEADFQQDLIDLVDQDALLEAPESVRAAYRRLVEEGPGAVPLATAARHLTQAAGFVLERCLNHGRFAWRARRHPGVHAAFRALFPDEGGKLVTSLDVTFFTPKGQPPAKENQFSAHADQNRNDVRSIVSECHTYQGVLYVWPAGPDGNSSTTVVWPGSHREVWPRMMEDRGFCQSGAGGLHYSEIRDMAEASVARQLAEGWAQHARRAVVPPGALFLWNSRTVHTGWRGGPRLAQAVCLEPEGRRSEQERLAKLRLAALGLPACHWASVGMQHDMSLASSGCFSGERVQAQGSSEHDGVVLPLRPAIRPLALSDTTDDQGLAGLVRVPFQHCGMWEPPEGCRELLEASVKDDFKAYL